MKQKRYVIPGSAQTPPYPQQQPAFPGNAPAQPSQMRPEILFPWANPKLLAPDPPPGRASLPPYFRVTTNIFPANKTTADKVKVPLGIVISPASVTQAPIIDCLNMPNIKCSKCNAYLCPQVEISSDGRTWKCPFCMNQNAINLNISTHEPFNQRVELSSPVYDVCNIPNSNTKPDVASSYCFIFEISYTSYSMGFTQQMVNSVKTILRDVPDETHISIITQAKSISLYDLINLNELCIADLGEAGKMLLPSFTYAPKLGQCRENVDKLLEYLLKFEPSQANDGNCIASAFILAKNLLQRIGGIIFSNITTLPQHGSYPLANRYNPQEDEFNFLKLPPNETGKIFRDLAFSLNRYSISVHLFVAGINYMDLSTVAVPSGLTCGQCIHYEKFDHDAQMKFHSDLFAQMTCQYFWDSCVKIKCSSGVKITKLHTNCTLRNNDLVCLPILSRDDAIAYQLLVENNIPGNEAIFQVAMMFATSNGQRFLRAYTFTVPVSSDPSQVLNSIDEATLATIIMRNSVTQLLTNGPDLASKSLCEQYKNMLSNRAVPFVSSYHLIHSILCDPSIIPQHPYGPDGRMALIIRLRAISINDLLLYLYPRMFVLDNTISLLPLSNQSFSYGCAFLFHTVDRIYIWVNDQVSQQFLLDAFGCNTIQDLPQEFPDLQTQTNQSIHQVINESWGLSGRYLPVEIMSQGNPKESIFSDIIVDNNKKCGFDLENLLKMTR